MRHLALGGLLLAAACAQTGQGITLGPVAADGGVREYLVLGSTMSYEQCRSRGGLVIRDRGSPMVACDPRVRGTPAGDDEFAHPDADAPAS